MRVAPALRSQALAVVRTLESSIPKGAAALRDKPIDGFHPRGGVFDGGFGVQG